MNKNRPVALISESSKRRLITRYCTVINTYVPPALTEKESPVFCPGSVIVNFHKAVRINSFCVKGYED
jgi:hypothetical protein